LDLPDTEHELDAESEESELDLSRREA